MASKATRALNYALGFRLSCFMVFQVLNPPELVATSSILRIRLTGPLHIALILIKVIVSKERKEPFAAAELELQG